MGRHNRLMRKIEDNEDLKTEENENNNMGKPKKRIYNPVTGTYYEIRQRSTVRGEKGTIKGKWKSKRR